MRVFIWVLVSSLHVYVNQTHDEHVAPGVVMNWTASHISGGTSLGIDRLL